MIHLRPDCLVFEDPDGTSLPRPVQEVTLEVLGPCPAWLDGETLRHVAEAVLHYFRVERGQTAVSMSEFSVAVQRVLRGLGVEALACLGKPGTPPSEKEPRQVSAPSPRVIEADLLELTQGGREGCELWFFPHLRAVVRSGLNGAPVILRFRGLQACVKQLAGARRWTPRCQALQDQIVDYLRTCLNTEPCREGCGLVVG